MSERPRIKAIIQFPNGSAYSCGMPATASPDDTEQGIEVLRILANYLRGKLPDHPDARIVAAAGMAPLVVPDMQLGPDQD